MPQNFLQLVAATVQSAQGPHWTAYVSSLAVPFIAAIVALIAYRQFKIAARQSEISLRQSEISLQQAETSRNKLKLDLFDKRMAVYEAARKAIGTAATKGRIEGQDQIDYLVGVNSAKWLFDEKLSHYLEEELWHKIVALELHESMSKSNNEKERVHHIVAKSETLQWLVAQYKVLDALSAPYLRLGH